MAALSDFIGRLIAGAIVYATLKFLFKRSPIKRDGKPLRKPPNTLPLVGNGILFLQARQKLFTWFAKCERIFGYETFELYVPSLPPGIVINDPANLDFVFKNEGAFSKGDFVKKPLWDLFGKGIINSDGESWKVQRKAGMAFLNTKNLQVLTDVALPQYLSQSIENLRATAEDCREVDLQAVFHEITTQLMGKMAYNMDMHGDDEFTLAFDYASGATAERVQNPLWRITEIFFGAGLRRSVAVVKAFGKRIVDSAVDDREKGQSNVTATNGESGNYERLDQISGSLIQSLLDSLGDREMVADAALNYLSAGRDTTAQALTWTFHLLMHHRYATARIRKEVQQLIRRNEAQKDPTHLHPTNATSLPLDPALLAPTLMPYTLAVFNEALRLYPPIPFEMRQAQTPITLPDGTFLPKDSVVVWCLFATNRSRLTWGEDADLFRPERWLTSENDGDANDEERVRLVQKSPSEFPVFNGGPRMCLGKKMAELIAVQVIANVIWTFDFVPVYEGQERSSRSKVGLSDDDWRKRKRVDDPWAVRPKLANDTGTGPERETVDSKTGRSPGGEIALDPQGI
ncbi:hypothetical protein VMCG_03085 [Cytospora schulzeri]|uniref:Uncharacterized protein n=1 Tax=Cytospora schulzeri TaxID=448051 RepID=A0A423WXJ0_9PEZI|nr:hypothetical protein VMCG_03085 [Valsa malicola]